MEIWVDADSCPVLVREMICKAGARKSLRVRFVANRAIPFPKSSLFSMTIADAAPDAADDYIVEHARCDDLAVTRDIPLAKRLVDRGIRVLNDRGNVYTEQNINERLALRNLMLDLYTNGIYPEKTGQFGKKELNDFANALDRELTRMMKAAQLPK
jgi:uncharacterized protein YaiI (UPF0178 family)